MGVHVEVSSQLDEELRQTRDMYHKLREEFKQLQGRLKFFDKVRAKKKTGRNLEVTLKLKQHKDNSFVC